MRSGPTWPPTPKRVWHCWHVLAKTARPSDGSGDRAGFDVRRALYRAIDWARSAVVSRTVPQTRLIRESMSASLKLRTCLTRSAVRSARGSLPASTAASRARAQSLRAASVFKASRRSEGPRVE